MDLSKLHRASLNKWIIPQTDSMNVPGVLFGDESLISDMDEKVYEQIVHVTHLPGIVQAAFAMPDAHWGYGFPIGGVAAFDPHHGVISAGGVGFDISCGVRTILTGLQKQTIQPIQEQLADLLFQAIPAGVGSRGNIHLQNFEIDAMLTKGAVWAISQGYGYKEDLERIENSGIIHGADPDAVSEQAKKRQADEMGTLGSGNHYVEVQVVDEIYDEHIANTLKIIPGEIVISIHCGSRGLGHQIATDYAKKMLSSFKLPLLDRDLACAPIRSEVGQAYLAAMRAGCNCALANRQILTHLIRTAVAKLFPDALLPVLYDVSHNTCQEETHLVEGIQKTLFVHRKGATRSFGPGHPDLPSSLQKTGQPVLIGGTMGTSSYILVGVRNNPAFASACHGAGRQMSRHQASRQWQGKNVIESLSQEGIIVRGSSFQGIAEEAPGAYKNVETVVEATHSAGLAKKIAKLSPIICIKG
jgi:tRNA-splicing ligase RtcB